MNEEWRAVPGHPNYRVSSQGVVRHQDGQPLSAPKDNNGYPYVNLGGKRIRIHRLVTAAFLGDPSEGTVVRHLDGNPANNCIENLEYGTFRENMLDIVRHGRNVNANKTHCKRGHLLAEPNLRNRPGRNGRECLACHRSWESIKKEKRA